MDLACGSGEVTLALPGTHVEGIDPFTGDAYCNRTGQEAEALSFEDIAVGVLESRNYSLVISSFALHLVERSRMPTVVYQLARVSPMLLVITPHKRPELVGSWRLLDDMVHQRVRARLYVRTVNKDEI